MFGPTASNVMNIGEIVKDVAYGNADQGTLDTLRFVTPFGNHPALDPVLTESTTKQSELTQARQRGISSMATISIADSDVVQYTQAVIKLDYSTIDFLQSR